MFATEEDDDGIAFSLSLTYTICSSYLISLFYITVLKVLCLNNSLPNCVGLDTQSLLAMIKYI